MDSQGLINGEKGMHHGKFTAKAKNSCFLLSALELLVFILCAAYVLHIHCMLAQFYTYISCVLLAAHSVQSLNLAHPASLF